MNLPSTRGSLVPTYGGQGDLGEACAPRGCRLNSAGWAPHPWPSAVQPVYNSQENLADEGNAGYLEAEGANDGYLRTEGVDTAGCTLTA